MSQPLKVIVVGGGIGGLSAAIAILLAGHSVTVLESQEKIEEVCRAGRGPFLRD
jgi:salicylate hydroxylase